MDWSICPMRKGLGLSGLEERRLRENVINVNQYWREGAKRAKPFSAGPSDKSRARGHKHRGFLGTWGMGEWPSTGHKLEVVQSPSLEIFQSHLQMVLVKPALGSPAWTEKVRPDDLWRYRSPQLLHDAGTKKDNIFFFKEYIDCNKFLGMLVGFSLYFSSLLTFLSTVLCIKVISRMVLTEEKRKLVEYFSANGREYCSFIWNGKSGSTVWWWSQGS